MSRKLRRQNARLARQSDTGVEPRAEDFTLYRSAFQRGNYREALKYLEKLAKRFPKSASIPHFASECWAGIGNLSKALQYNERAERLAPDNTRILCMKAHCLMKLDEGRGCRPILERVLAQEPDSTAGLKLLARLIKSEGDQDGYLVIMKRLWGLNPGDPGICLELSVADSAFFSEDDLAKLDRQLTSKTSSALAKSYYAFASANVLLHRERDEEAFAMYQKANALVRDIDRGYSLHPAKALDIWRRTGISRAFFEERHEHGLDDQRLALVVGCSRSGKSLVESILSLYPGANPVGESGRTASLMRDFINALQVTPNAYMNSRSAKACRRDASLYLETVGVEDYSLRIDTMPDNLARLPLLSLWFPKAPMIFCERNILDLGVSQYFKFYGTGNRNLFDLYEIGQYIRAYEELMDFFEGVLPNPIVRVNYDKMVEGPREFAASLYDALGLETDGVDFSRLQPGQSEREHFVHPIGSLDAVTTIRKHARGIGARFEHHLAPLLEGYNTPIST